MNKYINEVSQQPQALQDTFDYLIGGEGINEITSISELWKSNQYDHILFTGMGSSYFTAQAVACLFNKFGIRSYAINTGELLHYNSSILSSTTLLFCISQSGESYEIVKLIEKLNQSVCTIAVTNEEQSTLSLHSKLKLLSKAGKEKMTSSKTYISIYLSLYLLGLKMAGAWNDASNQEVTATIDEVENLISGHKNWLPLCMNKLAGAAYIQLTGRGPSFASVCQGALMLMEGSGTVASGLLGGEFRHGPMEMVNKNFKAIVFAPEGETFDQSIKIARDIAGFDGQVILLSNHPSTLNSDNILQISISAKDEFLFPIPALVPIQFIMNQIALNKGNIPGSFSKGAKITTIE